MIRHVCICTFSKVEVDNSVPFTIWAETRCDQGPYVQKVSKPLCHNLDPHGSLALCRSRRHCLTGSSGGGRIWAAAPVGEKHGEVDRTEHHHEMEDPILFHVRVIDPLLPPLGRVRIAAFIRILLFPLFFQAVGFVHRQGDVSVLYAPTPAASLLLAAVHLHAAVPLSSNRCGTLGDNVAVALAICV